MINDFLPCWFMLTFLGMVGTAHGEVRTTSVHYVAVVIPHVDQQFLGNKSTLLFYISNSYALKPLTKLTVTAYFSVPHVKYESLTIYPVIYGKDSGYYKLHLTSLAAGKCKIFLIIQSRDKKNVFVSFTITPDITNNLYRSTHQDLIWQKGVNVKNSTVGLLKLQCLGSFQSTQYMAGMKGMSGNAGMKGMSGNAGMKGMNGKAGMKGMDGKAGMKGMDGKAGMNMRADFGDWKANREGSGTSWQPDSSPMFSKILSPLGGFNFDLMGTIQAGYVNDGGKRGNKGLFTNSMLMLMGNEKLGGGILGLHFMTSLDAIINGRYGVPNLFQTGTEVNGVPIADQKDPHNLISELALSYSHSLTMNWSGYIYGGPVGEPALGGDMFMHRPSGSEIPEAPISHDWFDGSHISFGVATAGIVYKNKLKLEGSFFNGHDPLQLYTIGAIEFNSASMRLSYNPNSDCSYSASYGYINSDVNQHRFTLSAAYSHQYSNGDNLSAMAYFGQNIFHGLPRSNGWLLESTYNHRRDALFMRLESVDKTNDLVNVPAGNYTVDKLLLGDTHNFYSSHQIDYGLGFYVGLYHFPGTLNSFYGKNPITFGMFLRIRPT